MKTDVNNVQLKETRKVSYAEFCLIAVVLFIATKFCTLPSVLAKGAGGKAIWAVFLLSSFDCVLLFFATKIAKEGGLFLIELKKPVKIAAALFFLAFFILKLSAFTREISTYYALSLFENIPVLPVTVLFLIACVLFATKGYAGIGRSLEIFTWLFAFVFLFVIIFTTTKGELFNALAMVNPDFSSLPKGFYAGLGWFGDTAAVAFLDLSGLSPSGKTKRGERENAEKQAAAEKAKSEKKEKGGSKKKLALASFFFSLTLLLIFYGVFTAVYGDAAKSTDYAFIKLSTFKANTDELGSANWPVIILWAILSTVYLSLVFLSGRQNFCYLKTAVGIPAKKDYSCFLLIGIFALALSLAFLDEANAYERFMTRIMNAFTIGAALLTVGFGVFAIAKKKRKENEKTN